MKNNKTCEIAVIGSGVSSLFFLRGLNSKFYKKTCVITGEGNNNKIKSINSYFRVSKKFGGLANEWLGGYSSFEKNELKKINKNFVNNFYRFHVKFLSIYNGLGSKYISRIGIKNFFKSNDFFKISRSKIMLDKNNILKVKKIKKVEYVNNYVKSIQKVNKNYKLILNDNKNITAKKIVLASGTIDTAILLSKLYKINKIYFKHQYYMNGIVFFPFKNFSFHKIIFPSFFYNSTDNNYSGSIDFYNLFIKNFFIEKMNYFLNLLISPILKKMIFFNVFLNSKFSDAYVVKKNDIYEINSIVRKKLIIQKKNEFIKEIKKFLKQNFKFSKFLVKIFEKKLGIDKHYFGIFFNKKNKKLSLNSKSELKKFKNIYVCDQSALNLNTSKFVTFLSLANSYRVGLKIK